MCELWMAMWWFGLVGVFGLLRVLPQPVRTDRLAGYEYMIVPVVRTDWKRTSECPWREAPRTNPYAHVKKSTLKLKPVRSARARIGPHFLLFCVFASGWDTHGLAQTSDTQRMANTPNWFRVYIWTVVIAAILGFRRELNGFKWFGI